MSKSGDDQPSNKPYMNELFHREELLWLHQSQISWLKEGDRNTCFFHKKVAWRARKNKIKKHKDANGSWQSVPSTMERMATSYFQEQFTRDPTLVIDFSIKSAYPSH
jgi:hypothetical protein